MMEVVPWASYTAHQAARSRSRTRIDISKDVPCSPPRCKTNEHKNNNRDQEANKTLAARSEFGTRWFFGRAVFLSLNHCRSSRRKWVVERRKGAGGWGEHGGK
jgi:hypothetical protein